MTTVCALVALGHGSLPKADIAEAVPPPRNPRGQATPACATFLPPLPALGSDVWSRIAALLDVKTLGRLACVARTFVAVVQEGATLALQESWPKHVRQMVLHDGDVLPLRQLHEASVLSATLQFTLGGPNVVTSADQTEATHGGVWQTAVCCRADGVEMRTGRHFCEFTLAGQGGISGGGNITHAGGDIGCWVGVVPASFDPRDGVPAINATPSGWLLYTQDCQLFRSASTRGVAVAQPGDVVGLLLSLSETEAAQQDVRGDGTGDNTEAAGDGSFSGGSLTVFLNGTRCGVLLRSSALHGPLRWAADVVYGASVRIRGAPPPLN